MSSHLNHHLADPSVYQTIERENEAKPTAPNSYQPISSSIMGQTLFLAGSYSPPQVWSRPDDIAIEFSRSASLTTPDRRVPPAAIKPSLSRVHHIRPNVATRKKLGGTGASTIFVKTAGLSNEKKANRQSLRCRTSLPSFQKCGNMNVDFSTIQLPPPELDTMPEEVIFSILVPDEILSSFGLLNRRCRELACHHQLWEDRLQKLHPIIHLLDLKKDVLAERRSKGKVQIAALKGTKRKFSVRTVSLETTNAGKDDGVPTSCLRELSLIGDIFHPNIVQCFGATVQDAELKIISEYCGPSLMMYLTTKKGSLSPDAIKNLMRQLFSGVAELHGRGIIHRNIKSDNIVIEEERAPEIATLKICDLSMGRAVDFPLGMYTPEDPKERDRSYREQRRLYNRAPELILRQNVYGLEVDIWSIGCVFLEITLGQHPFRCESEIGLVMATLQLCGTPDVAIWDRLSSEPEIFLKVPRWEPIDFRAVAKVLTDPSLRELGPDAPPLKRYQTQIDAVKMLLNFGAIVGTAGLHLLERLLIVPGCFRITAFEALRYPYFASTEPNNDVVVLDWIHSWNEEQSELVSKSTEGSQHFFNRFIEDIKKKKCELAGKDISSAHLWGTITAMEEKSVRLPSRYDLISAVIFNYTEELEKLRPNNDITAVTPAPATTHPNGMPQNQTTPLTPAPRRSRRLMRRRRESATPTELDSGEMSPRYVSDNQSVVGITDRESGDQRNEIENLYSQTTTISRYRRSNTFDGNTYRATVNTDDDSNDVLSIHNVSNNDRDMVIADMVDVRNDDLSVLSRQRSTDEAMNNTQWTTDDGDLDFEIDFTVASSPLHWRFYPFITTVATHPGNSRPSMLLNSQPTMMDVDSDLSPNNESENPINDGEDVMSRRSDEEENEEKGFSSALPEERRRAMALSQSPVNVNKLKGQCSPRPTKSWKQSYWLWGKHWERLADTRPPIKRCAATSWIARNWRRHLSTVLYQKDEQSAVLSPLSAISFCYWPRVSPRTRMDIVNYLLGIQPEFLLKSQTLHIAVGLFDRYSSFLIGYPDEFSASDFIPIALTCLKLADLYNEVSKEYYKQDNIAEYAEFTTSAQPLIEELIDMKGQKLADVKVQPQQLLEEEKKILNTLRFDVLVPTVCWFVDSYLSIAKLLQMTYLVDYCHYLSDLALYSHQLLAYRPALQAQLVAPYFALVGGRKNILLKSLERLLAHFIRHRDELCASNCVWDVLDCISVFRDLLLNGRRYFDAVGLRNLEKLHPWVGRLAIPTPIIPPRLARSILPSSQDPILDTL